MTEQDSRSAMCGGVSATGRRAGTDCVFDGDVEVAVQVKHMPVAVGSAGVRWRSKVFQKSAIALKSMTSTPVIPDQVPPVNIYT